MSKFLLWSGLVLSIFFLLVFLASFLGFRDNQNVKFWPVILWGVIFVGSAYKLFFAPAKR